MPSAENDRPCCGGWGEVRDEDNRIVACPTCCPDAYGGDVPSAENNALNLTPEQRAALSRIIVKAARLGRTATLDPGAFVKRERGADGDYERLDQWQERALLAAVGSVIPPGEGK